MAMDKKTPDDSEGRSNGSSGGLGNLPPLSDFDSSGTTSDSDLPPLGAFESDSDKSKGSMGGLPPIDMIPVETPKPTGGNIKAAPPGFETPSFESPTFDTPAVSKRKERTGFQDIAADSDFSPETPEIGPGPDGEVDTPMFESAFGNAGDGGFSPMFETPAPTQAMETPMFGDAPKPPVQGFEPPQFDEAAFKPDSDFGGGTPVPDFSPDTAFPTAGAPAPVKGPAAGAKTPLGEGKPKKVKGGAGGGGPKPLVMAAVVLVTLVVGIVAGPFLSKQFSFIPNPMRTDIADRDAEIQKLNKTIESVGKTGEGSPNKVTPEQLDAMVAERDSLTKEIDEVKKQKDAAQADFDKTSASLNQVRSELDTTNEEYVKAQEAFEDLQNQTAIVQARQLGLAAEVDRLTGMVGTLEEANTRSQATKEGLTLSVDRLMIQIKEGMPLTPEKYSRDKRLAAVEDLKAQVSLAKWVTPALLDAYTNLYRQELEIAATNAYFFAKVPGQDRFGATYQIWAECLMKGNYAVYFRSIDGKNIGIYQNVAKPGENPEYQFRLDLPDDAKKSVEQEVMASRSEDFEQKIQTLVEKQVVTDGSVTPLQRAYDSL